MEQPELFPLLADGLGPAASVEEYVRRAVALALREAADSLCGPVES